MQLQLLRVIPRPQLLLPFLLRQRPLLLADPLRLQQLLEVHLPQLQRYLTSDNNYTMRRSLLIFF
jgi:hypothetical protein